MGLPSIPDNFYKFILLLALACLGLSYILNDLNNKDFSATKAAFFATSDSLAIKQVQNDNETFALKFRMAAIEDSINLISHELLAPTIDSRTKRADLQLRELLNAKKHKLVEDTVLKRGELMPLQKLVVLKSNQLKIGFNQYSVTEFETIGAFVLGMFLLTLGLAGLVHQQFLQDELMRRQIAEKERAYDCCQSCGKIFNSLRRFGKNKDGSTNKGLCHACYHDGEFSEPSLTLLEVQQRAREEMNLKRHSKEEKRVNKKLEKLDRWNSNIY